VPSLCLRLSCRGNKLHFFEVLHALAGRVAGVEVSAEAEYLLHNQLATAVPQVGGMCV